MLSGEAILADSESAARGNRAKVTPSDQFRSGGFAVPSDLQLTGPPIPGKMEIVQITKRAIPLSPEAMERNRKIFLEYEKTLSPETRSKIESLLAAAHRQAAERLDADLRALYK